MVKLGGVPLDEVVGTDDGGLTHGLLYMMERGLGMLWWKRKEREEFLLLWLWFH